MCWGASNTCVGMQAQTPGIRWKPPKPPSPTHMFRFWCYLFQRSSGGLGFRECSLVFLYATVGNPVELQRELQGWVPALAVMACQRGLGTPVRPVDGLWRLFPRWWGWRAVVGVSGAVFRQPLKKAAVSMPSCPSCPLSLPLSPPALPVSV